MNNIIIVGPITIMNLENSKKTTIFDTKNLLEVFLVSDRWFICDRENYVKIQFTLGQRHKTINLHSIILRGERVDHKDGSGLNNLESNLRYADDSQNMSNREKYFVNATSKYKGVNWHKSLRKWRVSISHNKIRTHVGYFSDEIEAAKAYDIAAIKYHKEFAVLNFPTMTEPSDS